MIDKTNIIRRIMEKCNPYGKPTLDYETSNKIIQMIEDTPEWIECKYRMPENHKIVLVWFEYFRYGDYNMPYQTFGLSYAVNGEWSGFVNDQSGWKDLKILAWAPLPGIFIAGD